MYGNWILFQAACKEKLQTSPLFFIDDTHFRSSNKQVSPSRETLIICRTVRGNHEPSIAVIRPSDLLSAKTNYLYVSLRTSSPGPNLNPREQLPVWFWSSKRVEIALSSNLLNFALKKSTCERRNYFFVPKRKRNEKRKLEFFPLK